MTHSEQMAAIDAAIAKFPGEFSLRGFRSKRFRVNRANSFVSEGQVLLYTDVFDEETQRWLAFAKGTVDELATEVVR